jgi:hypothetical protein
MSNEHGSQVKDQGRRQCCHKKHKKFLYRPTCDVSLLSGHASYNVLSIIRGNGGEKGAKIIQFKNTNNLNIYFSEPRKNKNMIELLYTST